MVTFVFVSGNVIVQAVLHAVRRLCPEAIVPLVLTM